MSNGERRKANRRITDEMTERIKHFQTYWMRKGMEKAARIIEAFPCRFDPSGKAKFARAAKTIRRTAAEGVL